VLLFHGDGRPQAQKFAAYQQRLFSAEAASKHDQVDKEAPADQTKEKTEKETKFDYSRLNYYDLLNVTSSASDKEMKKSYLKLAKKYHPDVYNGINTDHFKKVNEAFITLKNPKKR